MKKSDLAVLVIILPALWTVPALADPKSTLVDVEMGEIPILITAPHGGDKSVPGVSGRKNGNHLSDTGTYELAKELQKQLQLILKKKPYIVRAEFLRKYIEANRVASEAYESPEAKHHYDAYHDSIRQCVDEIRKKWHAGIMIDLHGQSQKPDTFFRGSKNLLTVKQLVKRQGKEAVLGKSSIFGLLEQKNYKVFPPVKNAPSGQQERPEFNGGYTVQIYGSHLKTGIDAIQIEVGREYRKNSTTILQTAKDLAEAIAAFYERYYLDKNDSNSPKN